ncbi:MAG: PAS domain S-box protein [Smithella sp.]
MKDLSQTNQKLLEEITVLKEQIKKMKREAAVNRQAKRLLKKSEMLYRTFINSTQDMVFLKDEKFRNIAVNQSLADFFGRREDEIIGKDDFELMPIDAAQKCRQTDMDALSNNSIIISEETIGNQVYETHKFPVDLGRNKVGIGGFIRNITTRKRVEEELREFQRRSEDIIEFFPEATLIIDQGGKIIAWNRAIENMTGLKKEEMLGKGNYEYSLPFYGKRRPILIDYALHPDRMMNDRYEGVQIIGDILFGEAFAPNIPPNGIHQYATASVLHDAKGGIVAAIECIHDITEGKKLAERLNRAEKMEALGSLAGGVAHDLNNVLGVLVGYSELLLERLSEEGSLRRYAENIMKSSVRGAAIIQDLLTLARRGVTTSEIVNLNKTIFDYLRTPELEKLKSDHPGIKIINQLENEELFNIKGSPVHLGKTVMNLVFNAAEAISGRGEIVLRTENRYLDCPVKGYDEMKEGDYVVLTVTDTGKGISANDIGKIFEPFYTKKVMGRSGTGLGLAVVWGTVKDHNGYIDVQSEEGKGTTFTLYFPVTREVEIKAEKAIPPEFYMSRGESILVVDDVKEQRELAVSMLGRLGFHVQAVAGGTEAVEYIKKNKADLVVLDMIMEPEMDGMETYRRIVEINPKQKALIVSGFSENERVRKTQEMGAGAFVRKPYILEKIGLAARKELDRKG